MKMVLYSLFAVLSIASLCHGHGTFRTLIPNGFNVPNPCTADTSDVWNRVGHIEQSWTAGVISNKTEFGKDLLAAKKQSVEDGTGEDGIWEKLCQKDSDGDTRTNGAELGDINCLWRKSTDDGSFNKPPKDLFHPGIAEDETGSLTAEARIQFCPS